jgi:hypothetical protein
VVQRIEMARCSEMIQGHARLQRVE